jgi:LPXTG-motif cell wall-anchored protein
MKRLASLAATGVLGGGLLGGGLVLGGTEAAWAKSDTQLSATDKQVEGGHTIHFSGRFFTDDGAASRYRICLFHPVGHKYRQVAPCVRPTDVKGTDGSGTFTVEVKAPAAAGPFAVVPFVKNPGGKLDPEPSAEPVTVKVIANGTHTGPAGHSTARPTLPVTGSPAAALAGAGAAVTAGGIGLILLGRRRRRTGSLV